MSNENRLLETKIERERGERERERERDGWWRKKETKGRKSLHVSHFLFF